MPRILRDESLGKDGKEAAGKIQEKGSLVNRDTGGCMDADK
jgi:hypothetical protein